MKAFTALVGKQLGDSRWLLGISAAALFAMSWLLVFGTSRMEERLRQVDPSGDVFRNRRMMQAFGGTSMDFSSTAIEMVGWNHPFIILTIALWAIGRGTGAISGELERGTLDLTMSRPVSRLSFYASQVLVAVFGLMVLATAMVVGNIVGTHYNRVQDPPRTVALLRAGLNLDALGLAMFGYALLLSSLDVVRWRPNLIAGVLTLAMFVARIVSSLPGLDDYEWVGKYSIFRAYDPVEAAVRGANLGFNAGVLSAVAASGIVLGLAAFSRRDLPAGGG